MLQKLFGRYLVCDVGNSNNYGMVYLAVWMFFMGNVVSPWAVIKTFGPSLGIVALILWAGGVYAMHR